MPMYKRSLIVLLFIAAAASAGLFISWSSQDETVPLDASGNLANQTSFDTASSDEISDALAEAALEKSDEITVYISGEVNAPGLIALASDSRVGHAIEACGGFTPAADRASVNLAQKLTDGMHVNVMAISDDNSPAGTQAGKSSDGSVNINTADKEALDTLPGIGPAMAERIIEHRTANGSFQSIEDIKNVKGIGEAKFAKMKDRLRV